MFELEDNRQDEEIALNEEAEGRLGKLEPNSNILVFNHWRPTENYVEH
jgi:hypothetical protein